MKSYAHTLPPSCPITFRKLYDRYTRPRATPHPPRSARGDAAWLTDDWGNPQSLHEDGEWQKALDQAKGSSDETQVPLCECCHVRWHRAANLAIVGDCPWPTRRRPKRSSSAQPTSLRPSHHRDAPRSRLHVEYIRLTEGSNRPDRLMIYVGGCASRKRMHATTSSQREPYKEVAN